MMPLVVLLRGVNVGGHNTFRPAALAAQLKHLGAVNIGAAGTFVIKRPVGRAALRDDFARRLPFDAEIIICDGREIAGLLSRNYFEDEPASSDIVRFVSVLSRSPRAAPEAPMCFPADGEWMLKVIAREDRFIVGMYRRQMRATDYLGKFDRLFGVPVTTRNWNTVTAIARVLGH